MADAKSYLKVMAVVTTFIFLINAAIIYFVDPYWQFGFAPSNTIEGFNNQISESSMRHFDPELMLQRQKKTLRKSSADTIFIGSSRSLYGLGTCRYNNIQKIALSGINSSQMIQLFEAVSNNLNNVHVYIELGSLINDSKHAKNISLTALEALWSIHVLTRSLSNLIASARLPHQSDPLCKASWSGSSTVARDGKVFEDAREMYQSIVGKLTSSDVKQVVEKIAHQCRISNRTEGNPLNIVIYLAPVHPSILNYETLPMLKKAVENSIALNEFEKRCIIEAYIFQQDNSYYQDENWFDLNHYKPNIGNIFLRDMLTSTSTH